jgi:HEAT repeat protein
MLANAETFEMACYALRSNRSERAAQALREAVDQLDGKNKTAVMNILGERGDEPSAPMLIRLLGSDKPYITESAATALGKIGTVEAAKALKQARQTANSKAKPCLTRAYLQCAQTLLFKQDDDRAMAIYDELLSTKDNTLTRRSALLGVMGIGGPGALARVKSVLRGDDRIMKAAAISNSHLLMGKQSTRFLIDALQTLPTAEQALLVDALAKRPDPEVRPAVISMADSPDEQVRLASLRAIGQIGNASSVKLLGRAVARGSERERHIALAALRTIRGRGIDDAVIGLMRNSKSAVRPDFIRVLSDRQVVSAVPDLFEQAAGADVDVRKAAFKALGRLANPEKVPRAIECFVENYDQAVQTEAERAIIAIVKKLTNEGQQADAVLDVLKREERTAVRCSLLRILGGIANRKALLSLQSAIASGSSDERGTAMRELAAWPNTDVVPVLEAALDNPRDETHRILAFRGYVRLLGQLPPDSQTETLKMYRRAFAHARTAQQTKLVLAGLANLSRPAALDLAIAQLDNESVKEEAASAVIKIAEALLNGPHKRQVKAAMEKVLAVSENPDLREKATQILRFAR